MARETASGAWHPPASTQLTDCHSSGANEAALVIGCLRRLQRRNFASICAEYRTIAGKRARAANERFIEVRRGKGSPLTKEPC